MPFLCESERGAMDSIYSGGCFLVVPLSSTKLLFLGLLSSVGVSPYSSSNWVDRVNPSFDSDCSVVV